MATIYARKKALEIDFYRSPVISSDWESLYRLSLRGQVRYLDKNIGIWRIHDTNETGTTDAKKLLENLSIWSSIYKDAVSQGMNFILAAFISAKCIAFFAQAGFIKVSMNSNRALVKFMIDFFKNYKIATLLIVVTPSYVARIIFCLIGYYRRRGLS
jgi:hypothetical protein